MDTTGSKAASGGMRRPQTLRRDPHLVPPLENGARLSRDEFHRRYSAMPHLKKAELVEGRVYMPSPVNHQYHGEPHAMVLSWLGHYRARTPGAGFGDNSTVLLDLRNEVQPDATLFIDPRRGGQVRISERGYLEGSPELVVEVSASSASYDLHEKLEAYRRNGVREYVVWRTEDEAIDWFVLRGMEFVPQAPGADGLLKSTVFPGLWLDPDLMLNLDLAGVHQRLDEGLASSEHAAFVKSFTPAS